MKQIKLITCLFLVVVLCCSCGFFGEQSYTCDVDKVQSIQVISLDNYVEGQYRYEYTVLCEVTDKSAFIERLNSIECVVNRGEPSVLNVGYIVIRIDYFNGDYDLLYPNAQWKNRDGINETGYFFFNQEQFNKLICDYMSE